MSVTEPQAVVVPVNPAVGRGFTVRLKVLVLVHPLANVTVAEYVVVVEGETVMVDVVAPVLHRWDTIGLLLAFVEVESVADWPIQIELEGDAAIENALVKSNVMAVLALAVHPKGEVTNTVYVPAAVMETTESTPRPLFHR